MFPGHRELIDKSKMKTTQAFDLRIASSFTDSRSATTRADDCDGAEESVSNNKIVRGMCIHRARVVRLLILRLPVPACQDISGFVSCLLAAYFNACCSAPALSSKIYSITETDRWPFSSGLGARQ